MNSQHSYEHFIRNRYGDDTYQKILKHQKVAKSFEMVRRDKGFWQGVKKKKSSQYIAILGVDDLRPQPLGRLLKQPRVNF